MTRKAVPLVALAVLVPRIAAACPVCFGANDGPILQGSNMGILALLVVTVAVLGVFGAFFISLARRARAVPESPMPLDVMRQPEGDVR